MHPNVSVLVITGDPAILGSYRDLAEFGSNMTTYQVAGGSTANAARDYFLKNKAKFTSSATWRAWYAPAFPRLAPTRQKN